MARRHLDAGTLAALAARDLDRSEWQAAAWHLYKCRRCRGRVRQALADGDALLARLFEGLEPTDVHGCKDYSAVFARAGRGLAGQVALRQRRERSAARRLGALLAVAPEERVQHLEAAPDEVDWDLAVQLLDECSRRWTDRPEEAEELAALALEVAARLEAERAAGGSAQDAAGDAPGNHVRGELLADLRARAWAYVGNCRRIRADLEGATEAFDHARGEIRRGSGDAAERARVLDLEASLLRARRRFEESESRLGEAVRLYRSVEDRRGEARARVKQAMTLGYAGEPARAVEAGNLALELIDRKAEPRLFMTATYNLLMDLYDLGRLDDVEARLGEARTLIRAHGQDSDLRRLRWFTATVDRDRGRHGEAEEALLALRREFLALDNSYDAALVSLELAVLYLEQGRTAEVRRLAREMPPVVETSAAVLMVFRQAALADELSGEMVRRMVAGLRRGPSPHGATPASQPPPS